MPTIKVTYVVDVNEVEPNMSVTSSLKWVSMAKTPPWQLYMPLDAVVEKVKPPFEPGFYEDMQVPADERRRVCWLDHEPVTSGWARVNVTPVE